MTALYSITLISLSDIQTSGTEHMQREAKQIRSDTNIKPNIKGTQLKVNTQTWSHTRWSTELFKQL